MEEPEYNLADLLYEAVGEQPVMTAPQADIDRTMARIRAEALTFREVMAGRYALFDTLHEGERRQVAPGGIFFEPDYEYYRIERPLWIIRNDTDYSGRSLTRLVGENTRTISRIGVSATTGEVCMTMREEEKTPGTSSWRSPRTTDPERLEKPVADVEDLFDTAHTSAQGLEQIMQSWRANLVEAATRYKRDAPIAAEDYHLEVTRQKI
jgi:hypothetical protein